MPLEGLLPSRYEQPLFKEFLRQATVMTGLGPSMPKLCSAQRPHVAFCAAVVSTLLMLGILLTFQSSSYTFNMSAAANRSFLWQKNTQAGSIKTSPATGAPAGNARTIFNTTLAPLEELMNRIASGYDNKAACGAYTAGSGWGAHTVCASNNLTKPCYFYSFGISNDFSFDTAIASKLGCFGFAADPTVSHPALLGSKVTFHYLAAKSYHDADNRKWMFVMSMPGLRKWLGHERVAILKADCEGCEYSIARDVLQEDPDFFHHVDQFAVEVHYSRMWLKGREELHALAMLLQLLKEAELELIEMLVTNCAPRDEATGLVPELEKVKEKMRLNPPAGEATAGKYGHCHNYLFARLPKNALNKPLQTQI